MALPLNVDSDLMSYSPQFECNGNLHGGVRLGLGVLEGSSAFGGCHRSSVSSMPESCCGLASFDSENDSSFFWQGSDTLKCDDDSYCAAPCSPMGTLHCEDALDDDGDDEDATREWAPGRPAAFALGAPYVHSDAEEVLSNELNKEAELGPFTSTPIPPEYRGVLVHWMREVCAVRALSPATFFASVSLMDRFLRASGEGATPPSLLQLVALTCVAVTAKHEQQQCAGELLSLARDENGNLYKGEDSRMMELHLLDVLDWRLRTPTVYTFASLLLHRVINRPEDGQVVPPGMEGRFRDMVLRLAELAVADYELTKVSYSTLAASCLLVAETEIKGNGGGNTQASLKTVEAMRAVAGLRDHLSGLSAPVQRLYYLYKSLMAATPSPSSAK